MISFYINGKCPLLRCFFFFFFLLSFSSAVSEEEMPEPYRSVRELPFDEQGWFGNHEPLGNIIRGMPIKTVIEVGSWLGCSTRFIATTLPQDGVVYAVDTWEGSTDEVLHMIDPRLDQLYHLFLSNVKHAKLTHKIVPIRMRSLEAAKALNVYADLVYIDGAHDTENAYNDILAWYAHLNQPYGMMCGDDYMWESVRIAVHHAAILFKKEVRSHYNFWWFE